MIPINIDYFIELHYRAHLAESPELLAVVAEANKWLWDGDTVIREDASRPVPTMYRYSTTVIPELSDLRRRMRDGVDIVTNPPPPISSLASLPTPVNIVETDSTVESLQWSWDAVGIAEGYNWQLRLDGHIKHFVAGSTTDTFHEHFGLRSGQEYQIRVRSYGAAGIGAWSDWVGGVTELAIPSNFTATSLSYSPGHVRLAWDLVENATGYIVSYYRDGIDPTEVIVRNGNYMASVDGGYDWDFEIHAFNDYITASAGAEDSVAVHIPAPEIIEFRVTVATDPDDSTSVDLTTDVEIRPLPGAKAYDFDGGVDDTLHIFDIGNWPDVDFLYGSNEAGVVADWLGLPATVRARAIPKSSDVPKSAYATDTTSVTQSVI